MRFTLACAGAATLAALGLFATSVGSPPVAAAAAQAAQPVPPPLSEQPAMMVGSAECLACHEQAHDDWTSSRHSKMVQPAVPGQVLGDFSQEVLRLRGEEYRIRRVGSKYFITEPFFTGEPVEHQVDYTLGNRRIQHYLTTLEDGRVIVLPPTWDVLRREWFHNLEIAAPDQAEGIVPVQLWNKNCFGCHVSDQIKGFRPGEGRYDTTWLDFGTTCERCHGPGSRHVDKYMNLDFYGDDPASYIVQQTRLDHETNSMVCAQCHSFRDQMAFGFAAGDNYFDHFFPILEYTQEPSEDPTWYPDGKTRRFSTNTLGIWQSECFVEGGATCTGCHIDPHRPDIEQNEQLLPTNNGLCTAATRRSAPISPRTPSTPPRARAVRASSATCRAASPASGRRCATTASRSRRPGTPPDTECPMRATSVTPPRAPNGRPNGWMNGGARPRAGGRSNGGPMPTPAPAT